MHEREREREGKNFGERREREKKQIGDREMTQTGRS